MRVLIDGHNALAALRVRGRTHEEKRHAFLALVAQVTRRAVVFFDARNAPPGLFDRVNERGVAVVYCRRREADAVIVKEVRDADAPGALVVVTNDREVAGRCAQLGARAMGVQEFFGPGPDRHVPAPRRRAGHIRLKPEDFGLPDEIDLKKPPDDL
jgi:hypothetical protein